MVDVAVSAEAVVNFVALDAKSDHISSNTNELTRRLLTLGSRSLCLTLGVPADFPSQLALLQVGNKRHQVDLVSRSSDPPHELVHIKHFFLLSST